jgi:Flp pilus assembly pilin Flp
MSRNSELAQTIVEYALIVAAVSVVITFAILGFGTYLVDATSATLDGWL